MAQRNPSKITTEYKVDDALVQDANYQHDADDRQYIDNQIRGTQARVVELKAALDELDAATLPIDLEAVDTVTGVLAVAYGGLGINTLGAPGEALVVDGGGTGLTFAAPGGGSSAVGDADQVQTTDGAGALTAGDMLVAPAGAGPYATTGTVRFPNAGTIKFRNVGDTTDITAVDVSAADRVHLGHNSAYGEMASYVFVFPATGVALGVNGGNYFDCEGGFLKGYYPFIGGAAGSSPYGIHGGGPVDFAADADLALTAAECVNDWIEITDSGTVLTAPVIVDLFTLPAAASGGYGKTLFNNTLQDLTFRAGGAGTSRDIAAGYAQRLWIDNTGVRRAGPAFLP